MKKVMMLREKIYKAEEFEIDPNEPDIVLNKDARFGNEDDSGFWNEYYRVGMIDTDDEDTDQDTMFQDTAVDFYNLAEAQQCYSEMAEEAKKLNIEAEIRSREDAGLGVDKEQLKERYM
jgi:hypothetical protein